RHLRSLLGCEPMHAVSSDGWWRIANVDEIPSPALLIYPDRAEENVRRMVQIAGSADRLTPHVKTHKLGALGDAQRKHGIGRFKCGSIAEAEMTEEPGAEHLLLAYQPVGPPSARLIALADRYPAARFDAIADDKSGVCAMGGAGRRGGLEVPVR